MSAPLMPKATAIWLVENTGLTFEQIAAYCQFHPLEVKALADAEIMPGLTPFDPVASEQLSMEELERCQKDPDARLRALPPTTHGASKKRKGGRYTPVSKRQDKPDAIAWLIKNAPSFTNAQICQLLGTTNLTINALRERTHRHMATIRPRHPVALGLCSQKELDDLLGITLSLDDTPAEYAITYEQE